MQKIMTIMGTRPEIIRLSVIIKKLDLLTNHIVVFTNQNFDYNLSDLFFGELGVRKPDYYFENKGYSIGQFLSNAFIEFEKIIIKEKPDKVLVLGDTNSGILAIIVNKYGIPIFHCEAGNRCFDRAVPEETNRKLIDHLSTYNLPYTENSKQNLLFEGFHKNYVFKTGNPIYEVLNFYKEKIDKSNIIEKLNIVNKKFVLISAHRTENIDNTENLIAILKFINYVSEQFPVVVSLHPRTKNKMLKYNLFFNENTIVSESLGFFDFNKLSKMADLLVSDSGSNPEAACLFNVPSLIIRESTERQELIECGASVLTGTKYDNMEAAFNAHIHRLFTWEPPADYLVKNVSDVVINILLGK